MKNIRHDLIQKELDADGFNYNKFSLHNSLIENLYKSYTCSEMCENFYDSEPEVDSYTRDLSFMYNHCSEADINDTSGERYYTREYIKEKYGKEYTIEEAKRASISMKKLYDEYYNSERILTYCNWQELYFKGNWGMTQNRVNLIARDALKYIRKLGNNRDRLYITHKGNEVRIYYYGRDTIKKDYWFIFKKKGVKM